MIPVGSNVLDEWANHSRSKSILLAFSIPKTPTQVEKELGIKKLKLLPFLSKGLLKCLNDKARKGRLYLITKHGAKSIRLNYSQKSIHQDWQLIGKIISSPRQKLAVLLNIDSQKRTSEEIRLKASESNPHLSRISTKAILHGLIAEGLVETELLERKRFYWINTFGIKIKAQIIRSPLSITIQ